MLQCNPVVPWTNCKKILLLALKSFLTAENMYRHAGGGGWVDAHNHWPWILAAAVCFIAPVIVTSPHCAVVVFFHFP